MVAYGADVPVFAYKRRPARLDLIAEGLSPDVISVGEGEHGDVFVNFELVYEALAEEHVEIEVFSHTVRRMKLDMLLLKVKTLETDGAKVLRRLDKSVAITVEGFGAFLVEDDFGVDGFWYAEAYEDGEVDFGVACDDFS